MSDGRPKSPLQRLIPILKILVAAGLIAFLVWLVPFHDRAFAPTPSEPNRRLVGDFQRTSESTALFVTKDGARHELVIENGYGIARFDGERVLDPTDPTFPKGEKAAHVDPGLPTVVRYARVGDLLIALLMIFVASVVAAYRWDLLLAGAGLPTGFGRAFSLTFIGAFFNNIMPGLTGGDIVKAIYIAREHRSQKTAAIITVLLDRLLGITGLAMVAGLVIPVDFARYRLVAAWIYGLLAVIALVGVVFFSRRVRAALRFDRLLARLPFKELVQKADSAVFIYRFRLGLVGISLLMSMVVHTIIIGSFALIGRSIGIDLALPAYFALIPIALIVSALPIAPSGWGVGEAASVFFLGTVGVSAPMALALFLVYRMEQMAVSLVGGVCLALQKDRVSQAEVEHFGDADAAS